MLLSAALLDIQDKFQLEKLRNWWACEYTYKESAVRAKLQNSKVFKKNTAIGFCKVSWNLLLEMVKDLDFGWAGMEWHLSKLKIPAQSPVSHVTIDTQCTHPGSIQFVSSKFGGVSPNQSWKWVIGSWMLERSNSLTAVRRGCLKVASENNCCNVLRERKRIWGRFVSSVCLCVCNEVMTELATQAPGEPSSDQKRGEGDEDE